MALHQFGCSVCQVSLFFFFLSFSHDHNLFLRLVCSFVLEADWNFRSSNLAAMDDEHDDSCRVTERTPFVRRNISTRPGRSSSPGSALRPPSSSSSSASCSSSTSSPLSAAAAAAGDDVPKAGGSHTVVNILCVAVFIAASAAGLTSIPMTKLVEDAFCRQYYGDQGQHRESAANLDEDRRCKKDLIQSQMAFFFGIAGACDAVVGFCAALPWGVAADR